jgi:hypothetical protein
LGGALLNGEVPAGCQVRVPLRTMNRHGLICGATGSGKTKTLQILAEQLSLKGVPSLLMDVKGDLSGIASPGTSNEKIEARHAKVGEAYTPTGAPVELLSLSKEPGARLRATVSEFGPVLLGRILELNDTQQSVLALVFKYCDDNHLPLLDLKDLRRVLQFVTDEGKEEIRKQYGSVSGATVNIILRKLIEIEQQGAEEFFGERSFDVNDLLATRDGKGVVHIVRLTDIQDKPRLFSTFMLCLLAEIYSTLPGSGRCGEAQAGALHRRGPPDLQHRHEGTAGTDRDHHQTDPLERGGGVLLHAGPQRRARRRARPARPQGAARPARLHRQGPHHHQEDRAELSLTPFYNVRS